MNPERIVYGRLTINDDRIDLGRASVRVMMQRFIEQYAKKRYDGEKLRLTIELADDKLTTTILSREAQLEQEAQQLYVSPDEEVFPGVTAARAMEVMDTPEYIAYAHICEPANRIGVPDDTIEQVREAYKSRFSDCFDHFPLWRN